MSKLKPNDKLIITYMNHYFGKQIRIDNLYIKCEKHSFGKDNSLN